MDWKHTIIIVASILLLGIGLGYMIKGTQDNTKEIYQQIIESEQKTIKSLTNELNSLKSQREKMEGRLEIINKDLKKSEIILSTKINQLKIQNNVKIDSIINSSNDELLNQLRSKFNTSK